MIISIVHKILNPFVIIPKIISHTNVRKIKIVSLPAIKKLYLEKGRNRINKNQKIISSKGLTLAITKS